VVGERLARELAFPDHVGELANHLPPNVFGGCLCGGRSVFGFTGYDHRFFKRIFIYINCDSDGGKVRKTMKMFSLQSFFLHLS
jgi:hypothetical protein